MEAAAIVDLSAPSRQLIRQLRGRIQTRDPEVMPECVAWQVFHELRRRGEDDAETLFIRAIRSLHSRRSLAGANLPSEDGAPDEHRMTDDPMLGDLWKAYKKCIRTQRTGPASQLLRDIEEQLGVA